MNRSFRAHESQMQEAMRQRQEQLGGLRVSVMKENEKERNDLLLNGSEEFDAPLGSKPGTSPLFNISSSTPAPTRKTGADDFLNSENDKKDYDWLLVPPGSPLFPSLEMESQKTVMSQLGTPKACPTAMKSRLEPTTRSNLVSKQGTSSPGLNTSSAGIRRPSSSGGPGLRLATPTGWPTLTTTSKPSRSATPTSRASLPSTRPSVSAIKPTVSAARPTVTAAKPTISATKPTVPAAKPTVPTRSSTPSRSTARSSTPTARPTLPSSKPASRAATPTRRLSTPSSAPTVSTLPIKSSSSISKSVPTTSRNPAPSCGTSPTVKSRPWKPSEMPGFSLDAPPNLRTSVLERPLSATRGRPGAPSSRSSSIEPSSNGRPRWQSCSPSRGGALNRILHASGSSVPAVSRGHSKVNDNVSPVLIGTKMVERLINMRKLAPPRQDDKHSPHGNLSGKSSSSPDSLGFGRTLSKKSLEMAIRHMDIRRSIPGALESLLPLAEDAVYSVPITQVSKTLIDTPETEGMGESEEETSLEITKTSETRGTKVEQKEVIEEDPFPSPFPEEKSSLPSTQSATTSSFSTAEGVLDEKSSFPSAQGVAESLSPSADGVVDTSMPIAQGAAESSLLLLTDGATQSSLPVAQVSNTLVETPETEETGLEITKTSETKWTKVEQKEVIEEDPFPSPFSDEKSSLPSIQSATTSSFPTAEGVVDEKSSLRLTQGAARSLMPLAEGVIDTLVPITQGAAESSLLLLTDGATRSSLPVAQVLSTTLTKKLKEIYETEESRESGEADVLSDTWSNYSFESMKVSEISELMALPTPLHSLKIEGCDIRDLPESVIKNSSLQHMYIIDCCSLKSFPKGMAFLKILYIRNCKKLDFPLPNENIQLDKLEDLSVGSSCDSLTDLSLHLFPKLRSLSIWDCTNLQKFSMPEKIQIELTSLEALEIRDCPNLEDFPTGGLPTHLKSIWFSNCRSLKKLPDQLGTLEYLESMFINDCPELETLSKQVLPSKLSLLRINFCNKLIPGKEWGLHGLDSLCQLEIEGECKNMDSFPVEELLPSKLSSLRISGLLDLKKFTGLKKLESLKILEISCCDKLQSLPEDGFPSSLSFLCIKECPLLKPKLQNKNGEDWSKIAHISCIEIDEEVIS